MEVFEQHEPKIKKAELKAANTCQLFLQVITIAELADLDGETIDNKRLEEKWRAKSSLIWPRQCAPTSRQWDIFRSYLMKTFSTGNRNKFMHLISHRTLMN